MHKHICTHTHTHTHTANAWPLLMKVGGVDRLTDRQTERAHYPAASFPLALTHTHTSLARTHTHTHTHVMACTPMACIIDLRERVIDLDWKWRASEGALVSLSLFNFEFLVVCPN